MSPHKPYLYYFNLQHDIPHSLKPVEKAKILLKNAPCHTIDSDIEAAIEWHWNLK